MDNVEMVIEALKNRQEHLHIENSPIPFEKLLTQALTKEPRLMFYIYSYSVSSISLKYDIHFIYNKESPKSFNEIILDDGNFTILDYPIHHPLKAYIVTMNVEDLFQRIEKYFGEYTGKNEGMYGYDALSYSMEKLTPYQGIIVTFSYVLPLPKLQQLSRQAQSKAREITRDLTNGVAMPPAIKVYLAMSYLHQNVSYDHKAFSETSKEPHNITQYPHSQIAYGPLLEHLGVCVGISYAFQYLMDAFNIECSVICGNVDGSGKVDHAWNLVKINHQYFHVDVTYNIGEGMSIHSFMKDDKNMKEYQWNHETYPKAIGIHYNYDFVEEWLEEHGQELIDAGINVKYIYPHIIE